MPRSGAFIPLLLLFLLPGVSPYCYTGKAEVCNENMASVPAHNLVGEGIDITTLEWTGASVVDTSLWRGPNGTCSLCRNPLQEGQVQRVPLAVVDWRVHSWCNRDLSSSVEESAVDVARAIASDVKNDWKLELGLPDESPVLALGGSQSRLAGYAYQKELHDKYMFVRHEVSCVYYRLRLPQDPPLTPHFSWALSRLPPSYNSAAYRPFLATYGTHYISQAALGGRVRQLTTAQTCRVVLGGLTVSDIKQCLASQFSLNLGLGSLASDSECREGSSHWHKWRSQAAYMEHRAEVTGGHGHASLLFSTKQDAGVFSAWMESLKTSPSLVSYSLMPIHTLLEPDDPRREALRQAVKKYVAERGRRRSCPRSCPEGGKTYSWDPCKCYCFASPLTNSMCCSLKRGMARLKVRVLSAEDLWGDPTSATDAYVRFLFQGRRLQTGHIEEDNNPVWFKDLDFGPVTLPALPKMEMEVWDSDLWEDDLLGRCYTYLEVGRDVRYTCHLAHGHLKFSYTLECGPNLGGNNCHEYVPARG
ncbi:perforin-1-like isoform X1 [Malaclemys terrapin pileata]|uniref:perforin-1-like isoform X1 n=2 Tax=Malaclemys terrapin pileata TaxID=2991368 RepID=UPI0023A796D8|nr:perforin-1-like isoform X1 [Malaclemys terrapin pileata]